MGRNSKIEWTHHSFNGWWGCRKVSPACDRCYAETFAKRVGQKVWGPAAPRRFFGNKHWDEPRKWNAAASLAGVRERVFVNSMSDTFEDRADLRIPRRRLWDLVEQCWSLDFLLLTKRPENILAMAPPEWSDGFPPNVWVGTTAEDDEWLERRQDALMAVPAVVRFLSVEPMLGPVDLSYFLSWGDLHWVIAGCESGPRARPMDISWVRDLRDQCVDGDVRFFFKQAMGSDGRVVGTPELDGRTWTEVPEPSRSAAP